MAITHVTVIDVAQGVSWADQTVLIGDRRIERVFPSAKVDTADGGTRVVDGSGQYLIPGLWDMHVHVSGDERALEAMLRSGITGARDMGGDFAWLSDARRRIESGEIAGPRLVLAGPALRGPKSSDDTSDSDSWVVRTPEEAKRAVTSLSTMGVDFVKVHEDLNKEVFLAVAEAARRKRLPLAGHVPASMTPAEVSDAGALSIEHLEWIPDICLSRLGEPPGVPSRPAGCRFVDMAAILRHCSKNGTWLDPTISSFRYWAPRQWTRIFAGFRDLTPMIRRNAVGILAGTDWSPSLESLGAKPAECLHDELELLVKAGFTAAEALRSTTLNPAKLLGILESFGTVESGKEADLVLLDGDPLADIENTRHVVAVIHAGRLLKIQPGIR